MTNRSSAKRHGGHDINERRGKTSFSKRWNKFRAKLIRDVLRKEGKNC